MWALAAPVFYVGACALAVRAHLLDPSSDVGLAGLLLALGFPPSFAVPAIFSTRGSSLATDGDVLRIEGRVVKFDVIRVEPAPRGSAVVHVVLRSGETRSFVAEDAREATRLAAALPPVSAPAGALAA
jgi:hypothetical protein